MLSDQIKKGFERAPHRSLLRACGVRDEDMDKPFVGVCNSYTDIVPGHVHLNRVAEIVKDAIRAAGGVPFEFNTIAVDDGLAMGHAGMKFSLPSRELIAPRSGRRPITLAVGCRRRRVRRRQQDMKDTTRQAFFIMTGTLHPDLAAVRLNHAARDGQPQTRPRALEFRRTGRVQIDRTHPVKLLKDQLLVVAIDADAGVRDQHFDKGLHAVAVLVEQPPRTRWTAMTRRCKRVPSSPARFLCCGAIPKSPDDKRQESRRLHRR